MAQSLESLKSLGIGKTSSPPANFLLLRSSRDLTLGIGIPKFKYENLIGKFRITEDQEYSEENVELPRLIPLREIDRLRGTYLGGGYDNAILIAEYQLYHELKQEFFFKYLIENQYFSKVKKNQLKKPDIICFGGRITDPLQSPLLSRYGEWSMYGARFNDTIYLWDVKKGGRHDQTQESFYGLHFEALMTGKNPVTEPVNELEKILLINQVSFGKHQLLLVNEVDGVDANGTFTEFRIYKKCSFLGMKAKYTKMWSQNIVCGVDKFVFGRRDDDGRLQETEVMNLNQLEQKIGTSLTLNRAYEFEDRLLTWIKAHLNKNDPKIVKKFSWPGGDRNTVGSDRIECSNVPIREVADITILSEWFLTEAAKQF